MPIYELEASVTMRGFAQIQAVDLQAAKETMAALMTAEDDDVVGPGSTQISLRTWADPEIVSAEECPDADIPGFMERAATRLGPLHTGNDEFTVEL